MSWISSFIASFSSVETEKTKKKVVKSIKDHVEDVRTWFEEEYDEDRHLYDKVDFDRIMKDSWSVARFILLNENGSVKALDMLKSCLQWRKKFGINTFDPLTIPREIYNAAAMFIYSTDVRGRNNIYFRGSIANFPNAKPFAELVRKFLVYNIQRVDSMSKEVGSWNLIVDAREASTNNLDFDTILFLQRTLTDHFPLGLRSTIIYGATGFMKAFASLAGNYTSTLKFLDGDEIFDYVAKENLPDFMGGTCNINYRRIPKKAKSVVELRDKLKLDEKQAEQIRDYLKPFMVDESQCALVDTL